MKRLQIMIEEDLDAALAIRAAQEGTSKAALIRRCVREQIQPLPSLEDDPILGMIGVDNFKPEPVDDVVYPR